MRTGNPALNARTFAPATYTATGDEVMTLQGTVNKIGVLLLLTLFSASWTWRMFFRGDTEYLQLLMYGGLFGGLIFALITVFKKEYSMITAPLYALLEGLFLGAISAVFEASLPGIVIQAVALTFGILISLLLVYKSRLIKVTENFKLGVAAATGGIFLIYMLSWVMGMFGVTVPFIHENGWIGIGISLFIVVIASLNLVLDFDFIESGAESGAPKYMEWYAAFGLMVTLIWLYIEILRLLTKLQSRD